jgi:hypothetical protein
VARRPPATGGDSEAVRAELRTLETALAGLRLEFAQHESTAAKRPPLASREWIELRLAQLEALLGSDSQRARSEIRKHLEEDLSLKPLPAIGRKWRVEITARVKQDSLLGGQEAVRAVVGCGGWI